MNLDKILNLALNKALIGKNRIKQVNSNEIADFVNKHLEAINYTRCSTELNTSFKKGEKVIACNKLEGTVVSSETRTMVKVKIKGTTIGINARSLELKSI